MGSSLSNVWFSTKLVVKYDANVF